MKDSSEESLERVGIMNGEHRKIVAHVLQRPAFCDIFRQAEATGSVEKLCDDPLAECWREAMLEQGFGRVEAIRYTNSFVRNGITDAVAITLTPANLVEIGIENKDHIDMLLAMIQRLAREQGEAVGVDQQEKTPSEAHDDEDALHEAHDDEDAFHDDFLGSCWYEVLREYGLTREDSVAYAKGLSEAGVNQDNAAEITDEVLEIQGVTNATHRKLLLRIIRDLMRAMREDANEATEEAPITDPAVTEQELQVQQLKNEKLIKQYENMEKKLADIFAGNTGKHVLPPYPSLNSLFA